MVPRDSWRPMPAPPAPDRQRLLTQVVFYMLGAVLVWFAINTLPDHPKGTPWSVANPWGAVEPEPNTLQEQRVELGEPHSPSHDEVGAGAGGCPDRCCAYAASTAIACGC
jgi:hypothetical protein